MPSKPKTFTARDYLVSFGPDNTIAASYPNDIFFQNLNVSSGLKEILDRSIGVNVVAYSAVKTAVSALASTPSSVRGSTVSQQQTVSDPYVAYARKKMMVTMHELYSPSGSAKLPKLQAWLDDRHAQSYLQVVSDAQGGWWASSLRGETTFENLPPALRQLLKPANPDGKVIHLALGLNNTFIAIFENGNFQWDLGTSYPDLDAYLVQRTTHELIYASLDPFTPQQYFAAFSDATILFQFPDSAAPLKSSLIEAEDLRVIIFSDTVRHSTIALPQNKSAMAKFLDETADKVNEKLEEEAAAGIVTATLGVAQAVFDSD